MANIVTFFLSAYKGLSKESWMLSVIMFINRSGSMVLPFLGVYLTEKLDFSLKQTGTILSFYGLGAIFGAFLGGKLSDKIGYFKVQVFSLILCIPGLLLIPEIKNIFLLSTAFFLQSMINEIFIPANSVAITVYSSKDNRTRAFSLNRLALNLGFFIGPSLGGILFSISTKLIFHVNAVTTLISAVILYAYFKNKKNNIDINKNTPLPHNFHSPYNDQHFVIFIFFCIIYTICLMQLFSTLPLFYKSMGFSKIEIGIIFGYCGILLFIIEMPLVKWVTTILTSIHSVLLGLFFLFNGYLILVFYSNLYLIFFSITLISISNVLVIPFLSSITSIRAEGKNIGAYMGLFGGTFSVGLFLSPFLGLFIVDNYGFSKLWIVTCILIIVVILGLYYTYIRKFK